MPNTVVLMSDEHNPFYSEPYGHATVRTPHMLELAGRGVVYDSAYCPSPLCMPSRSAFASGRRVHEIQTYSNCNANVDPSPLSYGAALARRGVHSAHIGKCDFYAPGRDLGFSEMIRPGDRPRPGDINHRRNPMAIRKGSAKRAKGYGPREKAGGGDARNVDAAVGWIRDTAPTLESPWALVVNVVNPHFPHFAPTEFWGMYPDGGDLPTHGAECESARHPYAEAISRHFETDRFGEEDARGLRRGYLACVSFVDRQLGRIAGALRDAGIIDATNLVYTSDHGDMLGKFGMWWKCSLYEDAARIPMIAAGPDFAPGRRVSTPVDLHDLRAGIFAAAGVAPPPEYLGRPLQDMPASDGDRVVFSEYHGHGAPGSSYMVRKGRWKYLHYAGAPAQLFDLEDDPDELTNVAEAEAAVASDMAAELNRICSPEAENERAERFIERQLGTIEAEAARDAG